MHTTLWLHNLLVSIFLLLWQFEEKKKSSLLTHDVVFDFSTLLEMIRYFIYIPSDIAHITQSNHMNNMPSVEMKMTKKWEKTKSYHNINHIGTRKEEKYCCSEIKVIEFNVLIFCTYTIFDDWIQRAFFHRFHFQSQVGVNGTTNRLRYN